MRGFVLVTLVLSSIGSSFCFQPSPKHLITSARIPVKSNVALFDETSNEGRDLTGYSLWVKFTGFGVEDMNFAIELNQKFQAVYSRGLESAFPGFWRVLKYDDGKETVEVTQPVLPEYMLFFDLWEPSILWRGRLDVANNKIVEGEVTTNKKRFGLFPYTETLATFEAELLAPGQKLPTVVLPNFADLRFTPPDDFDSPFDMKRYPQYFDPEFVEYFFKTEEAIAKGEKLPERTKTFFVANPSLKTDSGDSNSDSAPESDAPVSGKNLKERSKPTGKGGKSFGKK